MQLTELLFQKVKDLPADGQLSLKSGYVAVVSKASSLRTALTASVCPAPDDPKRPPSCSVASPTVRARPAIAKAANAKRRTGCQSRK